MAFASVSHIGYKPKAMGTAFMIVVGIGCIFGAFASFRAMMRVYRSEGYGTWWGAPMVLTGVFVIPVFWLSVPAIGIGVARAVGLVEPFPVQQIEAE